MTDIIDRAMEIAARDIDARIEARVKPRTGEGSPDCIECGEAIPEARRKAVQGCDLCIDCARLNEMNNLR